MLIEKLFSTISDVARENPDRTAFILKDRQVTYQLFENSFLDIVSGLTKGTRVGIFLENSVEAYSAIYACLYMDCTFVPLSIGDPEERLNEVLQNVDLDAIITNEKFVNRSRVLCFKNRVLVVSQMKARESSSTPLLRTMPLYILYTSGSTGKPKGVPISEKNLASFFDWALDYFGITDKDIFLAHPPLTFDLSVFNLILPFLRGSAVVLPETPAALMFPGELFAYGVTIALIAPRVTTHMIEAEQFRSEWFSNLRHILFCGEKLLPKYVNCWLALKKELLVHNLYGPTEATIACTYHTICEPVDSMKPVPIGREIPGTVVTLSENNEMILSGAQVSVYGYWRVEDSRFFSHPELGNCFLSGDLARRDEDGTFFWLGRKDDQVKVRGYRVELAEIEIRASSHPKVLDLVCFYDAKLEIFLIFYTADEDISNDLKKFCKMKLPFYMQPGVIKRIDKIPKTAHGKVDKLQLLQYFQTTES